MTFLATRGHLFGYTKGWGDGRFLIFSAFSQEVSVAGGLGFVRFFRHKVLVTVCQDKLQDQALTLRGRILHDFGLFKPVSVNQKNTGEIGKQGLQGFIDRMGESDVSVLREGVTV